MVTLVTRMMSTPQVLKIVCNDENSVWSHPSPYTRTRKHIGSIVDICDKNVNLGQWGTSALVVQVQKRELGDFHSEGLINLLCANLFHILVYNTIFIQCHVVLHKYFQIPSLLYMIIII